MNRKTILFGATALAAAFFILVLRARAGDACAASEAALEKFLAGQPAACVRDSDCDGYYLRADSCASAVVLPKPGVSKAREPQLLKLQEQVRTKCGELWSGRAACSPIAFQARCVHSRCMDALHLSGPEISPSESRPVAAPRSRANGSYAYAVVRPDCAPWDGPAITIYLTTKRSAREITAPLLKISLWRNLPPPLNQPISLNSSSQLGVATRCLSLEHCEAALSGTITLTSYTARGGAAGSYELKFKNGEEERGSFRADWQNIVQMCG